MKKVKTFIFYNVEIGKVNKGVDQEVNLWIEENPNCNIISISHSMGFRNDSLYISVQIFFSEK